jgi:hypothetical protein
MFPSRATEVPKMTHILPKMLEFSVFWDFNISGRKHSFELKFLEHSTHN